MVVITIDTKKDSREEINKAVEFLKQYLSDPDLPQGTFNLFDQDAKLEDQKLEDETQDEDLDIKPIFY